MIWQQILAAASLLAIHQAQAGRVDGMADSLVLAGGRRSAASDNWERRMVDAAVGGIVPRVNRRQSSVTAANASLPNTINGDVIVNADGTINMTAWENTANTACIEALSKIPVSTNPSGTCVCYNLPALDNVTGTFEADLRLYQLSTPRDEFAGIPPENIMVGLSYSGASVSPVSVQTAQKLVAARQTAAVDNASLKLLQTYLFVGQIKQEEMTGQLDMARLEALVMPTVTLTGSNAGQTVSTNVSSNEAAFVAGVFSQTVVMSDLAIAQAAVQDVVDGLHNNTVAFVLPGVQLILFPIGLIITSVWLVLGIIAYGIGTYERISYREQYRRRLARASKSTTQRI